MTRRWRKYSLEWILWRVAPIRDCVVLIGWTTEAIKDLPAVMHQYHALGLLDENRSVPDKLWGSNR